MKKQLIKNLDTNQNKGFTLIELLIVIAIIAVLATTIVISISSQTGKTSRASAKLGVSSARTLAFAEIATNTRLSGDTLCDNIYKKISGEKSDWEWTGNNTCSRGDLIDGTGIVVDDSNQICCHARGGNWVLWTTLPDADGSGNGKTAKDIYCADSNGFLGELDLSVSAKLKTGSSAKCQ